TREVGIVTLPVNPSPALKTTRIWNDPLAIVVSKEHPLFWKKIHDPARLAEHNAILPPTGTFTREILQQVFDPLGIQLKVGLSTHYLETIKMMVSIGLGWSVLPISMIDRDMHILKVKGINLNRTLGSVQHMERTLSNAARAFLKTLQQYADED
ncbi:MAG: LysR family transcriptional regulator substrate-binding protein, partial [Gammaproteobacteria bacterium]|nr:LysR family transcriptional regulator substrate-binding protein [Gammaproteobacteria bacterium]